MTGETSNSNSPRQKFQALLRELFQFGSADLDFGIYRIMNHKRDVVRRFIVDNLPEAIDGALATGQLAEQEQAEADLEEARDAVLNSLDPCAIDADGNLITIYENTHVGQTYMRAKEAAEGARGSDAVEVSIYNHLYTFFSRYYQDGDFISKRRYSRNQRYAIPYNGEEVYLHWANSDQYYVKTDEHFKNYDWNAPNGVKVHFRVQDANVEQNNVNGAKRFFLPVIESISWDAADRSVDIPFEYRPLTDSEKREYGRSKQQDKIIDAAASAIPQRIGSDAPDAVSALDDEHRRDAKGESVSLLKHHLRRYTRRNDSDFFIHKDLRAFLLHELDFYLKNEVLNLDEISAAGETAAEGWFQQMRLMKNIGGEIIDFLAQIEEFQKMLWEKKKFVVDTQYCVTLGNIPDEFHAEILENGKQWEEWRDLLGIDEADRCAAFLQSQPTLTLDTRHFSADFTDRLLASFDDLDGMTDGLLIHSENWQTLRLLEEKYHGGVQCVYIDPPFNTPASEIIYKNGYKQSSWLTLIADRISIALPILNKAGSWVVAIDDTEMVGLSQLLDTKFTEYNRNMVVVNHHPAGSGLEGTNVSSTHEYAVFMTPTGVKTLRGVAKEGGTSEIGFIRTGTAVSNLRTGRPNSFYAVLVDPNTSQVVGAEPPPSGDDYPRGNTVEGYIRIYPVRDGGPERVWRRSYKTVMDCIRAGQLICKNNKSLYLVTDQTGKRRPLFSNWTDSKYNAGAHGSNLLRAIFGEAGTFSYPKSINTVRDCVDACIYDSTTATVLDYFAGSGTTGHAVINLNREDDGQRKFILVEMGDHFDTVLLPRIKKVTFTPEWEDGKPKCHATPEEAERSPRIVKYMRLESYEDALDCIEFNADMEQMRLDERIEDYLIKYMLKWETRGSATLLNADKLTRPFSYKLRSHANGTTRERTADVAETFNYLLGLNVRTRRVYDDDERRYLVYRGKTREAPGKEVAVIWRDTDGWTENDHERDRAFIAERNLTDGADTTYINGTSCVPGATELAPLFHARMFAPVSG